MRIRNIILATIGEKRYLTLLANGFQLAYRTGMANKDFQDVYFLRKFIREGDICIDIGAHLGYFSLELGRLVKGSGKVFAVEPISKFNTILQSLLKRYKMDNVTICPVALGGTGEFVEMGIPEVGNVKKFGYARILEDNSLLHFVESEKVKNESGDQLFNHISRLDYIKCDVEGLEFPVISSLINTIRKYHPVILCEFADKGERIKVYELLRQSDYEIYALDNGKCRVLDVYSPEVMVSQNNYFIPRSREGAMKHLLAGNSILK
jgi:FkbM family methyltransferase